MTPPTNTEGAVTDVAARLTEAQRKAIRGDGRKAVYGRAQTLEAVWNHGLIQGGYCVLFGACLTPLGLAVRNHLTEQGVTAS